MKKQFYKWRLIYLDSIRNKEETITLIATSEQAVIKIFRSIAPPPHNEALILNVTKIGKSKTCGVYK